MAVRRTLILGVLFIATLWAAAWKVASDRAERELADARNRALREEIEATIRYAERIAFLARQKRDFDEVAPAHARILPVASLATDEGLLRDFQGMAEASGVRIVSVSIVEVK